MLILNADGTPMQIEVLSDKFDAAMHANAFRSGNQYL